MNMNICSYIWNIVSLASVREIKIKHDSNFLVFNEFNEKINTLSIHSKEYEDEESSITGAFSSLLFKKVIEYGNLEFEKQFFLDTSMFWSSINSVDPIVWIAMVYPRILVLQLFFKV